MGRDVGDCGMGKGSTRGGGKGLEKRVKWGQWMLEEIRKSEKDRKFGVKEIKNGLERE